MSDIITPADPAIDFLRDRVRQLETDIAIHKGRMDGATMVRDELLEVIATLTRKRSVRRPRAVPEKAPDAVRETVADARPSVFTLVPAVERDAVEGVA